MRLFPAPPLSPRLKQFVARAGARLRDFLRLLKDFFARVRGRLEGFFSPFLRLRRPDALFLAAGLLAGAGAASVGPARFLLREPWAPRRVALTFDDGPHPAYAGRLLDALRSGGARATFFVVGRQAEKNPSLLTDILRQGCELANHTYTHPRLPGLPRPDVLEQLDRTQVLLDHAGARGPRFFRPPGGRFDGKVRAAARAEGYHMVLWTVLPGDHESPPPEAIRRRVLADVQDGGVILLHSGIENTVKILPVLLKDLRARGYRCVTVGELLAEARPSPVTEVWLDPSIMPKRPELPPEESLEGAAGT